ncbi:MAG TPA: hypothetical protein VF533_15910 [Solirubrobacteraceae bacterium]|jgi:hypothetical protein
MSGLPYAPAEHAAILGAVAAHPEATVLAGAGLPPALTERLDAAEQDGPDLVARAAQEKTLLIVLAAGDAATLQALLDEPQIAAATLLLAGTGAADARAALEALPFRQWPRVRYVDLEYVAPRVVEEGRGHERLEGGLGLIVLDADAQPGEWPAPAPPYLPLARAIEGLRSAALPPRIAARELERLRAELADERARRERAEQVVAELTGSPSWQVTAPLRAAKHALWRPRP